MGPYGPGMEGHGTFGGIHDGWWVVGHVLPLLLLAALIGVIIWGVLRMQRTGATPAAVLAAPSTPARAGDPALEELRLRYARGEMARTEYLERAGDLGAAPGAPAPPAAPQEQG